MKKFPIKELAEIINAKPLYAERCALNAVISGVSTDSRTLKPGDCFFAITGENLDGHNYLSDAFDNGAICAVISKVSNDKKLAGRCLLKVDDTIKALGRLASSYRQQNNFNVISITGSVGKTTTRHIAYRVLSRHYRCYQAPKNFNNNIGLPLTLLGADHNDEIIITELATNHLGEIEYLTKIAQPNVALITNVHPVHLEGFGNLETIAAEKLSIAKGLLPNGCLIINADLRKWLNQQSQITDYQIMTFGKLDPCDIKAHNISYSPRHSRFSILVHRPVRRSVGEVGSFSAGGNDTEVLLPLPGAGNVENALAAFSICSRFGINIDDFAHAVKTLRPVPMRTEFLQIGTLTVLNDCYNANPASMKNALDILANLGPAENRRLVFICGDMAELGPQTQSLHAEIGSSIPHANVRLIIAVGNLAKIAAKSAKKSANYILQTKCFKDAPSACNNLKNYIKDDDIVLVKGSRIAKLEIVIDKLKELFS